MSRRALTLVIAGVGVVAALAAAALPAVPYVALTPGPTLNTLGSQNGRPLITITGHRTYPTAGHLNMVTVSAIGGPGSNFNIFGALRAWLSPHEAVVPESEIYAPGQTQKQVQQQDTQQMADSQQTATAAALCQLRIPFRTVDTIEATVRGEPAHGILHRGDVITAVSGTQVTCRHAAAALIHARKPGTPVALTVRRRHQLKTFRLRTTSIQGMTAVGVEVAERFVFPFHVTISIGNIGGPSAGLMFALAIIDKITPGNLTGGRFIAGTGEIAANGAVAPIGGIQQKLAGARSAGATIFLTPAQNCTDAKGAVPPGLKLVKVSSLSGAIRDLQALQRGRPVPSC